MRDFRQHPVRQDEFDRYFCLHCEQERGALSDMLAHQRAGHNNTGAISNLDFASGWDVCQRIKAEDAACDRMGLVLDSLRGADDFLLECGDA